MGRKEKVKILNGGGKRLWPLMTSVQHCSALELACVHPVNQLES